MTPTSHMKSDRDPKTLPTLRTLLTMPEFLGAELLTGHSHLDDPVAWVHTSEVLNVSRFLSGGELMLSTGIELARATALEQDEYIRSLSSAGVVALALELVQAFHEIPPVVLRSAKSLDFPLLIFREEVRFSDLTKAAHARILRPAPDPQEDALHGVLEALLETGRDSAFIETHIGPLLILPNRLRRTLLQTVEALVQAQFNITEAANLLELRRQSIYYRMEQLNAMLGNFESLERRLGLYLALELMKRRNGGKLFP
jgi:hypothetical protein